MARTASRGSAGQSARQLPVGPDARERLLEFYRERDRQYRDTSAGGGRPGRGVYALGIARLEDEADVFESYQILRAAGVELDAEAQAFVDSLTRDWRVVCRIDPEGNVWTASLRQKNLSSSW